MNDTVVEKRKKHNMESINLINVQYSFSMNGRKYVCTKVHVHMINLLLNAIHQIPDHTSIT